MIFTENKLLALNTALASVQQSYKQLGHEIDHAIICIAEKETKYFLKQTDEGKKLTDEALKFLIQKTLKILDRKQITLKFSSAEKAVEFVKMADIGHFFEQLSVKIRSVDTTGDHGDIVIIWFE